ncbi:MAG: hypothetical protein ACTSV3_06860 [Candidatus Thorarchaeota archaeon]|nr:MAG: hypothetical protein DRO87_03060 [Candidatus Thorarchaeota archaeon]
MHESEVRPKRPRTPQTSIRLHPLDSVSNPNSIHGIYPYRGKMSALDAHQVVSQFSEDWLLLDPFCGTGTVLYEAQMRGMQVIGVDNNPLACTIARGKTEPIDHEDTLAELESSIGQARLERPTREMPDFPGRYFHPKTADQIMRVLDQSHSFSNYLLSAFYGAICVAARACNGYLWTSTSIGRLNPPLRPIDFYETFSRKVRKHLKYVKGSPPARVLEHDARLVYEVVSEGSVDVVYTSPPYFDALDYTGYYSRLVLEILGMDRTEIRDGLIQRYSTYKEDMRKALHAIDRVVTDDSLIVFVVGDRRVHGRLIRGADFFAEISPWGTPQIVEREYTRSASALWDRINDTSRKEQVLVWNLSRGRE